MRGRGLSGRPLSGWRRLSGGSLSGEGRMGTSGGSGVDPLARDAPVLVRLTAATDSGSSNSDAITSNSSPEFTINLPNGNGAPGDAEAGDELWVRIIETGATFHTTLNAGHIAGNTIDLGITYSVAGTNTIEAWLEYGGHIGAKSNQIATTYDPTGPTISTNASQSVAENATLAVTLAANETVTWAIRTAVQDAASLDHDEFEISGTTLRWSANGTRNYESPSDTNTNNDYVVVIRATDTAGNTTDKTITVSVTDVAGPTITSASTANNAENNTLSHSLTANESATWSIVGGADQARFEISGSTLRWASNGTKNYEAPDDDDTNNTYVVNVRATSVATGETTDQTITITVTDVGEGTTTWDSAKKGGGITLSGGNLIATQNDSEPTAVVLSIAGYSTGKYYCEFTIALSSAWEYAVGISNTSQSLTANLGTVDSFAYYENGLTVTNSAAVSNIGTYGNGDVIGMAVDFDNNKIWFRKNGGNWQNDVSANPATNTLGDSISGVSGTKYIACSLRFLVGNVCTLNTGGSAYGTAAPSGFGNW